MGCASTYITMKLLLIFSIFTSFCYFVLSATPFDESEWQSYMEKYDKKYTSTSAMDAHKNMYMKNKEMVESHNKKFENKQETYKMCLNKFADMLPNEFPRHDRPITDKKNRLKRQINSLKQIFLRKKDICIPESVDWRKEGAVTHVKHQGNCGSCWAHATAGVIEGIYSEPNCLKSNFVNELNHEMLVVGYGKKNGIDYWIVKNSFGETWGENGYVLVKRGVNTCGIASDATFPIILPTGAPKCGTKSRCGPESRFASTAAAPPLRNAAFVLVLSMVNLFALSIQ
ncbi:hypothetical protein B566_EDAN008511 [Ephemera danica]|nr:hypothetical protein B566_EDAN008511 [Ephemera danica]